jgi:hypothetical protein
MGKVYWFGSGNMYFIDRAAAVPTPVKAGTLQEGSVEFSFTKKEVLGQNQFPDEIYRADGKISGKSKMAQVKMNLFASFFNVTPATGQIIPVFGEAGTIPATPGPYTTTVVAAANFNKDLGVIFAATGTPLTRVADSPAAGQYSLVEATGVFTFAAADQGKAVKFDYLKNSALVGKTLTIANQQAGVAPTFLLVLANVTGVNGAVLILYKCMSEKLAFATKRADAAIPEFDFSAAADDADNIGTLSLPE